MTSRGREGCGPVPPGSVTYLRVTCAPRRPLRRPKGPRRLSCSYRFRWSRGRRQDMRLCLIIRLCGFQGPHNLRLPFRDEDDCSSSILAALLRVTGLVAECLYHSLCTAPFLPLPPPPPHTHSHTTPPALLDIPPPHVSSVKWKCRPIKNRQPEADHCCTYANVDTGKYHTRRGRGEKKSKRGK